MLLTKARRRSIHGWTVLIDQSGLVLTTLLPTGALGMVCFEGMGEKERKRNGGGKVSYIWIGFQGGQGKD